jgi:phospholipid-binding lipoprotein MlaA
MTLSQWGYKNSNYFILPILGPSTVRDGIGAAIDYNFLLIYPYIDNSTTRYSLVSLDFIQHRANLLQYQDVMDQAAVDKYVFQRDAFMQKRIATIKNNASERSADANATTTTDDPFADE